MKAVSTVPGKQSQNRSLADVLMQASPGRGRFDWERDGQHWPNREASRFVVAGGIRWHVQVMGAGPVLLLLHGTGAATHSWRDLAPLLAEHFTVLAPDLPGHGFTDAPARQLLSLPGMANLLEQLLQVLRAEPVLVAGHSAGAAIGAQMCLDASIKPAWLVSINGALMPLSGLAGWFYSPIARFLAGGQLWSRLLARSAGDRQAVERLIDRTGSVIDDRGVDLYARLLRNTAHTTAALGMMANWDLDSFIKHLPRLSSRLLLLVGENDQMVPPAQADRIHELLPASRVERIPGCGHLLHEEKPQQTAELITALTHNSDRNAVP